MPVSTDRSLFVWHDLMTTDVEAAKRFYGSVLGWGTQDWEGPADNPYTMWTAGSVTVGGVVALPPEARQQGAPPHWLPYIGTADVDDATARTMAAGGRTYVPPRDIPDVGRFAVLADPQGAMFAAFTPGPDSPPPDGAPGVDTFSWHELRTTDHEAAFAFYSDLFGWEKTGEHDMGKDGIYLMYGHGDQPLGGMYTAPQEGPPAWLCYARVDDVDAAAETARQGGGEVVVGPMEVPGGDRIAVCRDPQGAMFAVHQRMG